MVFLYKRQTEINFIGFDDTDTYLQFIGDIQKLFEFHRLTTKIL